MSEETTNPTDHNDGTWSGLKKTIIASIGTLLAGGGTWIGVALFQGGEDKEEKEKTEQVAPAQQPVINLNVDNSSQNNSSNNGGGTTIIKERVVEKPAEKPAEKKKKSETEDSPW